jgi:hypothetical protein
MPRDCHEREKSELVEEAFATQLGSALMKRNAENVALLEVKRETEIGVGARSVPAHTIKEELKRSSAPAAGGQYCAEDERRVRDIPRASVKRGTIAFESEGRGGSRQAGGE